MDALLPVEQRYTSLKFRRVARRFDATRLDYADAAELVAFVTTVDLKHAQWMFHWRAAGLREVERLLKHLSGSADIERMVQENNEGITRADGLGALAAMQDGGWTRGSVPPVVRMALLDMRDEGISQREIGERLGLTHDQVRVMANGPRWLRPRAVGLLGLVAQG